MLKAIFNEWVAMFIAISLIWIIATILVQFKTKLSQHILARDEAGILPIYTFFAPEPAKIDIHLLFRYRTSEVICEWKEAPLTSRLLNRKRSIRWFFNPYRRLEKLLFDFVNDVYNSRENPAAIRHLNDYMLILTYVSNLASQQKGESVQYLIAGENQMLNKTFELLTISDFHAIDP